MGELDIYSYKKLCADLDVPVMATELPMAGFNSYAIWITERATDILRGDVPLKGGITTMIKTAHLAEAFGMQYEIHHGQNPLNNVAGLHVAMAIKNCEFYEWILPEGVNQYALAEPFGPDKNGLLHAPMKPGLGVEIDFESDQEEDDQRYCVDIVVPSRAGLFSSWPGLTRPSTSFFLHRLKTWMPGTRPGMTGYSPFALSLLPPAHLHERRAFELEHQLAVLVGAVVAAADDAPAGPRAGRALLDDLAGIGDGVADIDRLDPFQVLEAGRGADARASSRRAPLASASSRR